MNENDLWAAVDSQRLLVAELLEDLGEDEWQQPSLCGGWTVRDVAAHLTMQQMGFWTLLRVVVRHPGGVNAVISKSARHRAALPTEQFAAEIRAMVGSRLHNFGVTSQETLLDILVHGQDIAIPLGRELEMPPVAAGWAASRVWSFGGKGLARGCCCKVGAVGRST